jgi:hypothetical protein
MILEAPVDEKAAQTNAPSRRRVERIALTIPVRVDGQVNKDALWSEITRFNSISAFGAGFELNRKVLVGQLLLLTTSFPAKLRCFDFSEAQYRVWSLVRHCEPIESAPEGYRVGVAFLGKNPPISHLENPAKRYLLSSFNQLGFCEITEIDDENSNFIPEEKVFIPRRDERYSIPFEVFIEILDEKQNPLDHDLTFTENVSRHGSAIRTILDAKIGHYVRLNPVGYDLSILAVVRNRRVDEDGIPRLHLEFLDQQFPLEGIE